MRELANVCYMCHFPFHKIVEFLVQQEHLNPKTALEGQILFSSPALALKSNKFQEFSPPGVLEKRLFSQTHNLTCKFTMPPLFISSKWWMWDTLPLLTGKNDEREEQWRSQVEWRFSNKRSTRNYCKKLFMQLSKLTPICLQSFRQKHFRVSRNAFHAHYSHPQLCVAFHFKTLIK